jgi:hypothetical protein
LSRPGDVQPVHVSEPALNVNVVNLIVRVVEHPFLGFVHSVEHLGGDLFLQINLRHVRGHNDVVGDRHVATDPVGADARVFDDSVGDQCADGVAFVVAHVVDVDGFHQCVDCFHDVDGVAAGVDAAEPVGSLFAAAHGVPLPGIVGRFPTPLSVPPPSTSNNLGGCFQESYCPPWEAPARSQSRGYPQGYPQPVDNCSWASNPRWGGGRPSRRGVGVLCRIDPTCPP